MIRAIVASLVVAHGWAALEAESVPSLPDFGTPPSPMWSGFLDASAAENGTMLHYWYSQKEGAESSPSGAGYPVVLWLNGGPGSSSIGRGPDTQRESPKVRGIAGHIEQAERGAIRKSPQAHTHFYPLLPTAMVFVSYGFVLVQVQGLKREFVRAFFHLLSSSRTQAPLSPTG